MRERKGHNNNSATFHNKQLITATEKGGRKGHNNATTFANNKLQPQNQIFTSLAEVDISRKNAIFANN